MSGRYELIHGVPVAAEIQRDWPQIENFQARPDDILISTYPKSGTTWMQEIVDQVMNNGDEVICRRAPLYERVPFIELMGMMKPSMEEVNARPSPRAIKTHLPIQLVPSSFWEHNCKVIYVARNARDTITSYFHFDHMAVIHPDPGTFEEYIERFMVGNVAWGSWYDHVKGYWDEKSKPILYVFYEDLKKDLLGEVRKVAKFLEKDLAEDVLKKIAHSSSFEQMKNNPMANNADFPAYVLDPTLGRFMRKGTVGDWKTHFTPEQSKRFEENYHEQMSGSTLKFPTLN
uniref:Sulfotransferase n=1 Tax=Leptobrachium leishanense TaxID=445787 RepID=A0A8C5R6N1_9ANUR